MAVIYRLKPCSTLAVPDMMNNPGQASAKLACSPMTVATVIGFIAGALTTVSFVP